jgi:ABC-2 type transport system ATP-binding protein
MIELKACSYYYGSQVGLKEVSLSLSEGKVLGLLGPNGAGKTTLCRCISGFVKPSSGRVSVMGVDPFEDTIHHLKMGYVAGELSFLENISALDHIKLMASLKGCSLDLATHYMKVFDFNPNKKIKTYSKGNKQKLGLILALMHNPTCLILDEPSSGLDPLLQMTLVEKLLKLKKQGKTMLLSSHYFDEILKVCDDVAVLKEGQLVSVLSVEELMLKQAKKIMVEVAEEINESDFSALKVQVRTPHQLHVDIEGHLAPLFEILKKYTVLDFRYHEQSLEEQFYAIYDRGEK